MIKINKLVSILGLIIFGIAVYYLINTSYYVRFWADDFCSSVLLRVNGYWNSQIIWWKSWTGRYSYIAFLDLFELFGMSGARILPIILAVFFTIPLVLSFGVLGLLILPIFLINSPNIIQSFYWMTGSLNYFAPFIFLNFYLFLLLKKEVKHVNLIGFLLIFVAVGFSESFGLALLLFLLYLYLVLDKIKNRKLIIVGLFAGIVSTGLMLLSPGNAVRSSTVSHPDGLIDLFLKTFSYSKWYLIHLFYIKEFVLSVLAIIVGVFVFIDKGKKYFENPKKVILYSISFMIGITFVVVGLTYQAMNWEPPMRVMTIVNYMIIYSLIIASVALTQVFSKYLNKNIMLNVFCILVICLAYILNSKWVEVLKEIKDYATKWDLIEKQLIELPPNSTFKVDELRPVGKLDGLKDNKGWVATCIAGYYHLDKLEYK